MDKEDLNYLAGAIDSDGSIRFETRREDYYRFGFSFSPRVEICGSNHENYSERHRLFTELSSELNISLATWTEEHTTKDGQLSVYKYSRISGEDAYRFTREMCPYLREKREYAEKILSTPSPFLTGSSDWSRSEFLDTVDKIEHMRVSNGKCSTIKFDPETLRKAAQTKTEVSAMEW
jgi:hypothetical protein